MFPLFQYGNWLHVIIIILCGISGSTQQTGNTFYHLTTANGLSSNRANGVIQDREGFYWIATQDGLNRFDGSNCKIFQSIRNDSTSLSHNDCFYLLEDSAGDIWVATSMGVNRYKKNTGKFERFYFSIPLVNFEETNYIRGFTKDTSGNIWVSSYGLWQYNIYTGKWTAWAHDPQNKASLPPGIIYSLNYDSNNHLLWMSSGQGFVYLDIDEQNFFHQKNNPENNVLLASGQSFPFDTDDKGIIWFYNYNTRQVCNYNPSDNSEKCFPEKFNQNFSLVSVGKAGHIWLMNSWGANSIIYNPATQSVDSLFLVYYHPQSALSTQVMNDVFEDKAGNYWIPSMKGISIFNPKTQFAKYFFLNDTRGIMDKSEISITCITEQNSGIIWVGTTNGLYKLNTETGKFKHIKNVLVSDNYTRSLYLTNDTLLWIGGHHELLVYDCKKESLVKKISLSLSPQVIKGGQHNTVLVGSWSAGLFLFSSRGELITRLAKENNSLKSPASNKIVTVSDLQPKQHRWIGYNRGEGFSKFTEHDSSFLHFKIPAAEIFSRTSNTISTLVEDKKNNLWIGTYGGGLVRYDQANNNFTSYTQSDGLKGNFINTILPDDSSRLWITTSNGLSIFDTRSNSIINSSINLRLGSNDVFPNGIIRKSKNLLFFAEAKIVEINPALYQRSSYPSKILLNSFKVFDKEIPFHHDQKSKREINLSYGQNYISLEYSLLKPDPATSTQYAYKLEGFDNHWNHVRERRIAYYTNVPSGNYIFRVKATDESGNWSYFLEPFAISIAPPFWKRWWFYLSGALVIASMLFAVYRNRVNQLKKVLTLRTKISQDLHDEVGATLSGIKVFSELARDRPETGEIYLGKINKYSDEMLDKLSDIVWTINPENDSFDRIINKLYSYATSVTAAKNIQLTFDMDESLQKRVVKMIVRKNVYLIAKEAINNAVKYAGCKKLTVALTAQKNSGTLKITDDGIGFNPEQTNNGNGLRNIKDRAAEIHGALKINSHPGEGTGIELSFNFT